MRELADLLTGKEPPAIYRLASRATPASVCEQVETPGWRCFMLDGDNIIDKPSFLNACAAAMHFPDYFGKNWDAFEECLNDLAWLPAPGYLLLYDNVEQFARNAPAEWHVAYEILADAVTNWQKDHIPFVVLLRNTGNFVRGLPKVNK